MKATWTSEKPVFDRECFFLTATKWKEQWEINLYQIKQVYLDEKWYWGWCTSDGEEYDDLADLKADLYMIIPNPEK